MPSDRPLHPLSLLFGLGSAARRLLIPGLAVLFLTRGSSLEVWFMVLFIPAALGTLLVYASFRYRLDTDDIVLSRVFLFRSERHIPYARIQNLDLVQGPLQRLFGVAEVRIQTAAGGEAPEAHLKVLSLAAIEEMRRQLMAARRDAAGVVAVGPQGIGEGATAMPAGGAAPVWTAPVESEVLRLSPGDLTLLGLLSGRGLGLLLGFIGLLWQASLYVDGPDWRPLLRRSVTAAGEASQVSPLALLALLALGIMALVGLRLLSALWAIVRYYGFRLTRVGDDLRTTCGLLTRETATVPRRRIQLLALEEGPLQRLLRRLSVRVETAGGPQGGRGQGEQQQGGRLLAPLLRRADLRPLLGDVLPEIAEVDADWQPVAARAWRRIFVRSTLLLGLAALLVGVQTTPATGALLLAFLPLVWLNARRQVAHMGWAVTERAVCFRRGWWTRSWLIVRHSRAQTLALEQSPFDRRHGMAAVRVDTAGGGAHRLRIPYLEESTARLLFERLGRETDRTGFSW